MPRPGSLVTGLLGTLPALFYRLERAGPSVPEGPVLLVANHPNGLLDPLILFGVTGRRPRPLAKAPLFQHPLVGPFLHAVGGLPVHRKKDEPSTSEEERERRREEMFREATAALRAGDAVQIYPEGTTHSEPSLARLRTGAARIALKAEAEADWSLGLRIVPVGLTYLRKPLYRARALAEVGEPLVVAEFREAYEEDPREAAKALTDRIDCALRSMTLNLERREDLDLVDTAERLYAREKGWRGARDEDSVRARMPALREFARGLAWLRSHDPGRYERLATAIRSYRRRLERLGASEGEIPERYSPAAVARYAVRDGAVFLLGGLLALVGGVLWYLPYLLPRLIVRRMALDEEMISTYKLVLAVLIFPLTLVAWTAVAGWLFGLAGALAALVALPLLGWFLHQWARYWDHFRDDVAIFLRVARHRDLRDRLLRRRARLAAEIEEVARELALHGHGDASHGRDAVPGDPPPDPPLPGAQGERRADRDHGCRGGK